MISRVLLAFILIEFYGNDMKFILLVGISFIFVLSILYEISKTINNAAMVFIFVSLGYPLRFFIGLYAFAPELLSSNF